MQFAIVLIFSFLFDAPYDPVAVADDCDRLEVTYLSQPENGNDKVRIELTAKGGSEPYFYFFFDKKNNPINWDFNLNHCTVEKNELPKYAKVLDTKGCTKTIEFNESTDR